MKSHSVQKSDKTTKMLNGKKVRPLCLYEKGKKFIVAILENGEIPKKNGKYIRYRSIR